jgi:hypothetical protein
MVAMRRHGAAGPREAFLSKPSFAKRRLSILDPHVICILYTVFDYIWNCIRVAWHKSTA